MQFKKLVKDLTYQLRGGGVGFRLLLQNTGRAKRDKDVNISFYN